MLGQDNRNLARIVTVLGTVLARGSALVDPADAVRMVTLLQQMQSSLPPQVGPCPACAVAPAERRAAAPGGAWIARTKCKRMRVCADGCLGRATCRIAIFVAVPDLPSLACAPELGRRHGSTNALDTLGKMKMADSLPPASPGDEQLLWAAQAQGARQPAGCHGRPAAGAVRLRPHFAAVQPPCGLQDRRARPCCGHARLRAVFTVCWVVCLLCCSAGSMLSAERLASSHCMQPNEVHVFRSRGGYIQTLANSTELAFLVRLASPGSVWGVPHSSPTSVRMKAMPRRKRKTPGMRPLFTAATVSC